MRVVELFAGAGGMALGFHRAGFELAALAEIDPHACCVLRARFPGIPLYGDVQQVDGREVVASHGHVDLVTFGAPCQDLSVAGKREGLSGSRSSLFYDGIRIWEETSATYALYENVLGALNSQAGADFAAVLSAFVGRPVAVPRDGWTGGGGVVAGPAGVAAWRVLDAQFFGVPQRRRRVFVLGARPGGVDPAQVLLECDGVSWDSATGGEAGEATADDAPNGAGGGDWQWWDGRDVAPTLDVSQLVKGQMMPEKDRFPVVVPSLPPTQAGTARTGNERTEAELVVVQEAVGFVPSGFARYTPSLPTLRASGGDLQGGSEALVIDKQSGHVGAGVSPTLKTDLSHDMGPVVIGWDEELNAKAELMGSLKARKDGGGHEMGVLAFHENQRGEVRETPVFGSLAGGGGKPGQGYGAAVQAGRPRRLLPIECERLMGWDDGWTDVPDPKGKPMADSHRYKMCGNGVVSHVAEWIGRQLLALEDYPAS